MDNRSMLTAFIHCPTCELNFGKTESSHQQSAHHIRQQSAHHIRQQTAHHIRQQTAHHIRQQTSHHIRQQRIHPRQEISKLSNIDLLTKKT